VGRYADCGLCAYFTPVEDMDSILLAKAERWVARKRPGSRVLGWCEAYQRPVTYLRGTCPRYRPIHRTGPPITKFFHRG